MTKTSHVVVIRIATNNVIHSIDTGGQRRADELCEDAKNNMVMIANDDALDLFLTFISTKTYKVLGKITLKGSDPNGMNVNATNGIEQCQWSAETGKIYLAVPEVNGSGSNTAAGAVLVINAKKMKVENVFSVDHSICAGPQGLAFGPGKQIVLGCSNAGPGSIVINRSNGSTIFNLAGLNGNDEVWYNSPDNQYFLAGSNHNIGCGGTLTTVRFSALPMRAAERSTRVLTRQQVPIRSLWTRCKLRSIFRSITPRQRRPPSFAPQWVGPIVWVASSSCCRSEETIRVRPYGAIMGMTTTPSPSRISRLSMPTVDVAAKIWPRRLAGEFCVPN